MYQVGVAVAAVKSDLQSISVKILGNIVTRVLTKLQGKRRGATSPRTLLVK